MKYSLSDTHTALCNVWKGSDVAAPRGFNYRTYMSPWFSERYMVSVFVKYVQQCSTATTEQINIM